MRLMPASNTLRSTSRRVALVLVLAVLCACASSASASVESLATGDWSCRVGSTMGINFNAHVTVRPAHTFSIQVKLDQPPQHFHLTGTWARSGTTVHVVLHGTQVQRLTYLGVRPNTTAIEMRSAGQSEGHFAVHWKGDGHAVFQQTDGTDHWRADCTKTS